MNKASNYLYTGDNIHFLHRFDSESVDLIYLDPPFNSKRTYSAPIGSKAAGTSFKDMWSWDDIDEELLATLFATHPYLVDFIKTIEGIHGKPMMAYVLYMAQRIKEMHRVLKPTGSIYLHCDPTASHYLKIVMDKIFGRDNFRREIIWSNEDQSGFKSQAKNWIRGSDTIFFYTKTSITDYTFNKEYMPLDEATIRRYDKVDKDGNRYKIYKNPDGTERKSYLKKERGVPLGSVWTDIPSFQTVNNTGEYLGYPTQKPLKLLERIIQASSNEGDVVLDPFCGCATTCVAAQQLNRKWIGIDIEKKAAELLVERLGDDAGLFADFVQTDILPERTDITIAPDSQSVREKLYKAQEGKCNACGLQADHIRHFELDHIIPKSKGGSDTEGNYQLLCGSCNRIKGDRPMEYLRMRLEQIEKLLATQVMFGR